jgi:5-methyltetrahydropteroyltriglutamate--homocysteine methyltransferase
MATVRGDLPTAPGVGIDRVSLECHNSHVPIELIGLLEGKDVLVGAIGGATNRIEPPEEVVATISKRAQSGGE